jgi:hypothetical protein
MKKKGDRVGEIDDCVTSKGIVEEKLAHKKARLDNVVEEFDKSMEWRHLLNMLLSHRARDFAILSYTTPRRLRWLYARRYSREEWNEARQAKN